jgi:hypothetical protein
LAGLLVVTSSIALTPIDDRYLSPIFVPIVILILYLAKRLFMSLDHEKLKVVASIIIFSGGTILLLPSSKIAVSETKNRVISGAGGLNTRFWRESETAAFLSEDPQLATRTIFTNSPDAAYFLANVKSRYLPAKSSDRKVAIDQLAELTGQWPAEESYLVWFNYIERTWMFTDDELLSIVEVNDVNKFDDGAIYAISRKSGQIYERVFDVPKPKIPTDIHWGNKISLLGYQLHRNPGEAEVMSIQVFWQAHEEMERSYIVFFHLVDPETGELVTQADVIPRGWSYPTNQWAMGEVIEDVAQVQLSDLSPGRYSLYVGWYDSETGMRLPVTTKNEEEIVENSVLLTMIDR